MKEAIRLHVAGKHAAAEQAYRTLIKAKQAPAAVFQNLGALLRQQNKADEALKVYSDGLKLYPANPLILSNRANILRDKQPVKAYFDLLRSVQEDPSNTNAWITALAILRERGLNGIAFDMVCRCLRRKGGDAKLLTALPAILKDLDLLTSSTPASLLAMLQELTEATLSTLNPKESAECFFSLAYVYTDAGLGKIGQMYYEKALSLLTTSQGLSSADREELNKIFTQNAWNMGISLLKNQELEKGWQLYEYGLRVPADGLQKWQRSLKKPFSQQLLALWRGEPLTGKRLLLLEEQGIGDSMMFLTLVPGLLAEAARVDVIVPERLHPLYSRAFAEWGERIHVFQHTDLLREQLNTANYDYQSPLGSICRYRFTKPSDYAPRSPMLVADVDAAATLRQRYLAEYPTVTRLIGISWSGGGTADRIRKKSPPIEVFNTLLCQPLEDVAYVSLQYGDVAKAVQRWQQRGARLIHDPAIDPLVDMDSWLNQVAACDAVLSAANTTIHGAGGLGLPTLCLLSKHADWRWFEDPRVTRSYWYPSVGILRESAAAGWKDATRDAHRWIQQGCPMPTGPIATHPHTSCP